MTSTCPNCGKDSLEPIAGQFDTGVVAPDGGRASCWESGYQCSKCGAYTDDAELDRLEPTDPVECEYHEVMHQRGEQCPECLRMD